MNVVAFAAHPDDAELSCGGSLLKLARQGHKTGIVDLTRGEMGTRGTIQTRAQEAANAAEIIGVDFRHNLGLPDGSVMNSPEQRLVLIAAIRASKPDILLCNALEDRHPDHGNASILVREAAFLAGLRMIETKGEDGQAQEPFRPKLVLSYIQDRWIEPDIVVDISDVFEQKLEAVRAFKSQFFDPKSTEPDTYISSPLFMDSIETRAREYGRMIGVQWGEGFNSQRKLGVSGLEALL